MPEDLSNAMEGGVEFKPKKFSLGRPGDIIKGTYIGISNVFQGEKGPVNTYEIRAHVGKYHALSEDESGNWVPDAVPTEVQKGDVYRVSGGRQEIDNVFANSKPGEIVGIQFVEFVKGSGPRPFKKVLAKNFGPDTEVAAALADLTGETPPAEAAPTVEDIQY